MARVLAQHPEIDVLHDFNVDSFTVNGSSGADQITFDNVPGQILAGRAMTR